MFEAMKYLVVALLLLLLSACTTLDPVLLKHPKTGEIAQCGPYEYTGYTATARVMEQRGCIEDYQRQGYERVPR